ncbi:MAG: hypothetical protein WC455_12585 [Dehalococcoidia bacterium]|jgi:hypothetical protein
MNAINIGVSKETVVEARAMIMDILKSDAEQATIQKALDVAVVICQVSNTTVEGCMFYGDGENEK